MVWQFCSPMSSRSFCPNLFCRMDAMSRPVVLLLTLLATSSAHSKRKMRNSTGSFTHLYAWPNSDWDKVTVLASVSVLSPLYFSCRLLCHGSLLAIRLWFSLFGDIYCCVIEWEEKNAFERESAHIPVWYFLSNGYRSKVASGKRAKLFMGVLFGCLSEVLVEPLCWKWETTGDKLGVHWFWQTGINQHVAPD